MSMIMMGFIYPLDKHSWLHSLKKCQKFKIYLSKSIIIMIVISRGSEKSQIRQCLGFCTAEFWPLLVYESAVQKPKHCLTWDFSLPLVITNVGQPCQVTIVTLYLITKQRTRVQSMKPVCHPSLVVLLMVTIPRKRNMMQSMKEASVLTPYLIG